VLIGLEKWETDFENCRSTVSGIIGTSRTGHLVLASSAILLVYGVRSSRSLFFAAAKTL
jgi:hypothetical protein